MTGAAAMLRAGFASALLQPDLPPPAEIAVPAGTAAALRFAVYRNNVTASLVDAVAETFSAVRAVVGDEFFRAMAAVFVRQHPPRSPCLARYGQVFPDFLAQFAPAAPLPYLPDLARLELACADALHAADAEPLRPGHDALANWDPARAAELQPALHPSLHALASDFAVVSLWAAHQGQREWEAVDPFCAEAAFVVRPQHELAVVPCDAGTVSFIAALHGGAPIGEAAALASAGNPGFDLARSLTALVAHGALTGLALPEGETP